jgi:hypothetical protein
MSCDTDIGALHGFLSQVHVDPDLSIETFILEPDHGAATTEPES